MVHNLPPLALAAKTTLPPFEGIGPLGNPNNLFSQDPLFSLSWFELTLSTILGVLTVSAGIWFIFQIFAGAYQWLVSGGDKQGVENARKRITNAVVGLFIVIASYALIGIIGMVFGLNILSPAQTVLKF